MATGIQANGTDLDSIFEPRTTTKIADVNIDSNGGVDLSNRFEDIASGSAAAATGIQSGGADLNTLFAGIGTVGGSPTVSAVGAGDVNTHGFGGDCWVGINWATDGEEYPLLKGSGANGATAGTWLDSGSNSDVWVVFTRTAGATNWDSHTSGTRYNINVDQKYYLQSFGAYETISGYFQFYDAATGGNLLDTTPTALWSADYTEICPMCCFTPETLITMANGEAKPIIAIRPGDEIVVLGGTEEVSGIIVMENRDMYDIVLSDRTVLKASDDHPLFVRGKGWACVNPQVVYKDKGMPKRLAIGDVVSNGASVLGIEKIDYPGKVYTLENTEFYAGGILVA